MAAVQAVNWENHSETEGGLHGTSGGVAEGKSEDVFVSGAQLCVRWQQWCLGQPVVWP